MRRLVLALPLLVACGPSPDAMQAKVFEPFPSAQDDAFDCIFSLGEGGPVFGTDADDPTKDAFVHFGRETLRLTSAEPVEFGDAEVSAIYRVYDYPDFQVRLFAEPDAAGGYSGALSVTRSEGEDFVVVGEPADVTGTCAETI